MITLRSAMVALLVAPSLAGCREVARRAFTAPTVVLRDVRVRNVGLTGAGLDVYLAIRNPNPYALTATGATYRLLVNDSVEVGRGATTDTATAAAHDSTVVRLPLDVQWRGLGAAGMEAITSGAVGYRVIGSVTVATPVGGYDVPIDARGRVQPRRGS
jgi:LEA14-like dessication related protein